MNTKKEDLLLKKAKNIGAFLLTTEKDYVRIDKKYSQEIKFIKAKIKINEQEKFIEELKKFI